MAKIVLEQESWQVLDINQELWLNEHSKAHAFRMTLVLSQCLELCCSQQYRQSKHLCVSDQQHQVNHARKDPGLHREGLHCQRGSMYKCCAVMHAMECCCEATCKHELITSRPACQQPSKMTLFLMSVHSAGSWCENCSAQPVWISFAAGTMPLWYSI